MSLLQRQEILELAEKARLLYSDGTTTTTSVGFRQEEQKEFT
jgi:hypothetical protein